MMSSEYFKKLDFILLPSSDPKKAAEIKEALWKMQNNRNGDYISENGNFKSNNHENFIHD